MADFYERDLVVVGGAFTLAKALAPSVVALLPSRFAPALAAPLASFHHTCDCQPFYQLEFGGPIDGGAASLSVYAGGSNGWESLLLRDGAAKLSVVVHTRGERTELHTRAHEGDDWPWPANAPSANHVVPAGAALVPAALMDAILVQGPEGDGPVWRKDGPSHTCK
jgi:hypothetical protein